MPESRFRSDLATMMSVAAAVAVAAGVLLLAAAHTEMAAAVRSVAAVLGIAAVALFAWAMLGRRAEAARRDALDKAVDDEMGRKWQPGFAKTVGAFDKPWYILCGEPGVGKTAALRAGRLPMALGPDGQPVTDAEQGKQGTYLFDWWFFEDAVVLDSAGDLIAHADDRWSSFLGRVRDARPDRPVNGMLLAVSAADLIAGDVEQLREKAALLARQVRVAREQLRVRFPLYLLITKADLIPGFADFFPTGSDLKASFQILGWSDDRDPRRDDAPVTPADVHRGLDGLLADLRRRRTAVESQTTSGRPDAERRLEHLDEMFAFPAAVAAALDNLGPFIGGLLERVNAPEAGEPIAPPFFRGVYLTSALRTGEALDAELAKAFGTELRPTTRRAASDRAFFIRDLLLEKVVPEAGMVAPLTAVPAAAGRRARLIAAAAGLAAVAVIGGTLVGYRRTVARARADRDFWDALAAVPANQLPARLALFDPSGNYRGTASFNNRSVLATYERSSDLAATDTASPLLPASAALNRSRVAAHADLFRQFALAPALVPGPYAATAVPPVAATQAVMDVLTDTRGAEPLSVAALRADAAALVPLRGDAADRNRLLSLLASGVPAVTGSGAAAPVVTLTAEQRQRIAEGAVAWVRAELAERQRATAAVVARSAAAAADTLALAGALDAFEQGVRAVRAPEDLVEPLRVFDRSVAAHPAAGDAVGIDRKRIAAAVAPPPELKVIGSAITRLGNADGEVRRQLAGLVLQHTDFLANETAAAANGSRSADPSVATVREQQRAVDGRGTPLILARVDWFRTAATQARDAVATATTRPAATGWPALSLPPLLRQLADDDAARRRSFEPLSAVDSTDDRDGDEQCADHLFNVTNGAARAAVWTEVRPAVGASLWPTGERPAAVTLSGWMSAQSAVEAALRDQPPTNAARARAWVTASHDQLEQIARAQLATWRAAAAGVAGAPVRSWADVGRVVASGPATGPTVDRTALAVLRQQDLFPAVKESADAWADELDAPPASARSGDAVRAFLSDYGFGRDPVDAVRARLVADPAGLDRLTRLSASPLAPYWHQTLQRSVGLLSASAQRQTVLTLRGLHAAVAGRYPLTADGTGAWDGKVDAAVTAGLALVDAPGVTAVSPLVRQIQGADAVTPQWHAYLATLRAVVAFAQRPPTAWTVTFHATDGSTEDWAAVAAGPTSAGEPDNWHRFEQHRVVPLPWAAIRDGLAVRLSHDLSGTQPVAALGDLGRPWAVYRLSLDTASAADDAAHVRAVLDRHGDPATAVVPAVVPAAP